MKAASDKHAMSTPAEKVEPLRWEEVGAKYQPPEVVSGPGTFSAAMDSTVREAECFFRKYVVLPAPAYLAVALWSIATYFSDRFTAFPYLGITSPEKGCGKTRLLELLEVTAFGARRLVSVTEAIVYRTLSATPPNTLLIDELENLSKKARSERSDLLVNVLNAGYRQGAFVERLIPHGREFKVISFPTYGPKAGAAIRRLPETIADRAIRVSMQRRRQDEPIARFHFHGARQETERLRSALEILREKKGLLVSVEYEALGDLPFLGDRDAELWLPLFAVCRVFCRDREEELKKAALELTSSKSASDAEESLPLRLLSDIRKVWPSGDESLPSSELVSSLRTLEESPWASDAVGLDQRKLSRFLLPFEVRPRTVRMSETKTSRGYVWQEINRALDRYLPTRAYPPGSETADTPTQAAKTEATEGVDLCRVSDSVRHKGETAEDEPGPDSLEV